MIWIGNLDLVNSFINRSQRYQNRQVLAFLDGALSEKGFDLRQRNIIMWKEMSRKA